MLKQCTLVVFPQLSYLVDCWAGRCCQEAKILAVMCVKRYQLTEIVFVARNICFAPEIEDGV